MKKLIFALFLALAAPLAAPVVARATVNEVTARNSYTADGAVTIFAYGFRITDQTHLEVLVDGVVKTLTTDYTISGVSDASGGNVTFLSAPAKNANVTILRKQPLAQGSDYILNEAFPSERVEKDLDKLIMAAQQLQEAINRAVKFAKKSTQTNVDFPEPVASKYIRWNSAATALETADATGPAGPQGPAGTGYGTIQEEGSDLTQRPKVNFIGTGVTCVDNAGATKTDCTIPAYGTVQEEGSGLTQRPTINFIGSGVTCVDNAGSTRTDCTLSIPSAGVPLPNTKRWAYAVDRGDGNFGTPIGMEITFTGTQSAAASDANDGAMINNATGAVSGNDAGISLDNVNWRTGRNIKFQIYAKLQETTSVIFRAGVTNQSLATMVDTDNPAGDHASFRFSTVAGDTNYQACTKDGTTQGCTDTGIAGSTTGRKFEIAFNDSTPDVVFSIDGTVVATRTTNLPTTGTNSRAVAGVETQTAAARNLRIGWVYIEADK